MKTNYRVLVRRANTLEIVQDITAHGGAQAIHKVAEGWIEGKGDETFEFVAVPLSNWTEVPVSIEQPPPRLKVGTPVEQVPGQITVDDALAVAETDSAQALSVEKKP